MASCHGSTKVRSLLWIWRIPEIATISGISDRRSPILNGSKCSNEHFSTDFRQPDIGGAKRRSVMVRVFSRVALKTQFQNYRSHGSGFRGKAVGGQWHQEPVGAVQELLAFLSPAPCRQVAAAGQEPNHDDPGNNPKTIPGGAINHGPPYLGCGLRNESEGPEGQ